MFPTPPKKKRVNNRRVTAEDLQSIQPMWKLKSKQKEKKNREKKEHMEHININQ